MRVPRTIHISQTILEKCSEKRSLALGQACDVLVEPLQQKRPPARIRLARPEPPHLVLFEDIVATEELVCPFTCQHHLVARTPDESRKEKHRRGRGSHQWCFSVPDDLGKDLANLLVRRTHHLMLGAEFLRHALLKRTLVEIGVIEGDGKRRKPVRSEPANDRRNGGRVQPTTQISSDRNVSPETDAHRVNQEGAKLLDERPSGLAGGVGCRTKFEIPIGFDFDLRRLRYQVMSRRDFKDIAKRSSRRERRPEGEDLVQANRIKLPPSAWIAEE